MLFFAYVDTNIRKVFANIKKKQKLHCSAYAKNIIIKMKLYNSNNLSPYNFKKKKLITKVVEY